MSEANSDFSGFPPGMIRGGASMERSVEIGWRRTYMNHLAQLEESDYGFTFSGAKGATFKEITEYYAPFEFRGQKLMVERPLDPHEDEKALEPEEKDEAMTMADLAFTPLAMPMLSGPGAIAVTLSFATEAGPAVPATGIHLLQFNSSGFEEASKGDLTPQTLKILNESSISELEGVPDVREDGFLGVSV